MKLSRRTLLRSGAATLAVPATTLIDPLGSIAGQTGEARADDKVWRHGLSLFGDLKYPAGFKHFDYVNPKAPKGGTVRLGGFGTFDNFNIVVSRREGHDRGRHRTTLRHLDGAGVRRSFEPSTGCSPRRSRHPADFSAVTYRLRADAQMA